MTLQNKKRVELLSIGIGVIALLMLVGYLFKLNFYSKLPHPWCIPIQLNSSINFVLFSILLLFTINHKNRVFISYCSILLIVNGLLNLFYLINIDTDLLHSISIDPFFERLIIEKYTNIKPSPASIFCFILIGFSFLGIHSKRIFFNQLSQCLLHLVTLISILTILGLADNIPSLEEIYFFSNFSIYDAFMLMVLSIMIAAVQPQMGFVATFIGSKIGHEISRSLFPKIVISVLFLGYLRIEIAKTDLINEASANVLLET
jgi:hypothetical protein